MKNFVFVVFYSIMHHFFAYLCLKDATQVDIAWKKMLAIGKQSFKKHIFDERSNFDSSRILHVKLIPCGISYRYSPW